MLEKKKILIVTDEIIVADNIKHDLEKLDCNIINIVISGESAVQTVKTNKPDIVLYDIKLEENHGGYDFTDIIQSKYNVPVIHVSAYSDQRIIDDINFTAPFGYITMPFRDNELYSSIKIALHRFKLDKALKETKQKIEKLHDVAIELTTCKSIKSIFKVIDGSLQNMLDISKYAFYKREKDQMVLRTGKPLKIFKAKYDITEGIIGKILNSKERCISLKQAELKAIEPDKKHNKPLFGCRIDAENIFLAVSNSETVYDNEFTEMLRILFKHTNEALKRIGYETLLKKKALIDPLTNVYNRLYYNQTIRHEMKLAQRYNNDIGFIVCDINNLKKINDKFGHRMGDKTIKFIASIIVSQARESDIVIRSGGDEFLLILPQTGEEVDLVEGRMRKAMVDFNKKNKLPFPVSFAIGSAFWNIKMDKSIDNIIEEADNEMYKDKQNYEKNKAADGK